MIRALTDRVAAFSLFQRTFHSSENSYFNKAWRTQDCAFGLWHDGSLIGMAIVCGTKLEYISIDPDVQGKGFGSHLLQHMLSIYPTLYLNPADDPVLCRWYERNGFTLSSQIVGSPHTSRCYVRHRYPTRSKMCKI